MANSKELMKLDPSELIMMGAKYGLSFHTGMKKSQMVQQLSASAASGWMDVNAGLMSGTPEEDDFSFFGDSSMISDAANIAQIISGAGYTETFHQAMAGEGHHAEAVATYLNRLGVNSDDVWLHMPKANPNIEPRHFGSLNNYLRDSLTGNQDIMPEIAGHYAGDILGEYSTNMGGVQESYNHLAEMYVNKSAYTRGHDYNADVSRVASRLANTMGHAFKEVAYSAATGGHTSYMSAVPRLDDPNVIKGIAHPRPALNASGLPMGAVGSGINPEYSLSASLTGTPGWSPTSKEVYGNISSVVKSLAGVYSGDSGMNSSRHVTSERDMIMDSATRYADIEDVRSGYSNLSRELADDPAYSATNIRAILDNTYDQMDAVAPTGPSPVSDYSDQARYHNRGPGTSFTTSIDLPTSWNSGRSRRESIAIANLDSAAVEREVENGPIQFHNMQQGSDEWLNFRKGFDITGSTIGAMLGSNADTRPWAAMVDRIGLQRGKSSGSEFQKRIFARGHATEAQARQDLSREMGIDIRETGAITNSNYPGMMYSPDGLIGDDALWEHKNPETTKAGFADLLAGDHPDYMDQIQFGMMMTGRSRTLFSQTRGGERRDQWIDADPNWYDQNKTKIESIQNRLQAGRDFLESNPGEDTDRERITGARRAMMGDGIWRDVSQRSNRGFSAAAGTSEDPFVTSPSSAGGTSASSPLALAVKEGILGAQEENRQKASQTGGLPVGDIDPFQMNRESADAEFDTMMRRAGYNNFGAGVGGGGGGGGGRGSNGGSFYDDFGRAGGALAAGVAGGSISSLTGGAMQALMATPWGRIAGMGIGAVSIGAEAIEGMNDFIGSSLDAGLTNANEYSAMSQGMEMLGANQQQAARLNRTTHSAYNTLLNGDPSGAVRIVQGTRGLITIGDIRQVEGDPVALARVIQERGRERGWSMARIAGAMEMAGLDGMARAYVRPERTGGAQEVVEAGRDSDVSQSEANWLDANAERSRLSPSYLVPQSGLNYGGEIAGGVATGIRQGRETVTGVSSSIYEFIAGKESGGNPLARSTTSSAYGSMQTLAGTRRDPGFGVEPARDDSPEEAARVGRDYYDAMFKRYGDHDKAMAAYTDGPGTVDAAIKNHGSDWLSVMPAQAKVRVKAFHDWQQAGNSINEGAGGFTRNGVSYGQTPTIVQVNIDAKVNGQTASATVSTPTGQTVTQQVNVGNGASQRR